MAWVGSRDGTIANPERKGVFGMSETENPEPIPKAALKIRHLEGEEDEVIEIHSSRGWWVRVTDPLDFNPEDAWGDKPKIEFAGAPRWSEIYLLDRDGIRNNSVRYSV